MNGSHWAVRTDLYELTMMQGYWAAGRQGEQACFHHFFRSVPENGGYCIVAGVEELLKVLADLRFESDELEYLRSLGTFNEDFLTFLADLRFTCEVRALAEGTVVFPNEPIFEIRGPLIEAQWVETLVLNSINYQTLIATKASRIASAARPATVMEFGLRRAHGPLGGLWASRSAYLAGCVGTSNVEAGLKYSIPVYGTHAHSWIMSFASEVEAFDAYADVFPDSSILLIDTYDTLEQGLVNAITTAKRLEKAGHRLRGIRLDSGDLAYLSKACRKRLDAADLDYVKILASSDIDEYLIQDLKIQEAPIDVYGVGTRLATAFQEPSLNGVYKLVSLDSGSGWRPRIKISSNPAKTTIPEHKQIWRWEHDGEYLGDALSLADEPTPDLMIHPEFAYKRTTLPTGELRPLLETRLRDGQPVGRESSLEESRERCREQLGKLPAEHRRLANPHTYRVGLSDRLWNLRKEMIEQLS